MAPEDDRERGTLGGIYRHIRHRFRDADLDTPDLDARLLVCHSLSVSPATLVADPERPVSPDERMRIDRAAQRRLDHEPVARIIGEREFWGRAFRLSAETLEPRPDTETLVEAVTERLRHRAFDPERGGIPARRGPLILDLGTGTGAILISLLSEIKNATGIATDISIDALLTARENARRHDVADRMLFLCANYLDALRGGFDVIVSNPPYIPSADIAGLSPEVVSFDPMAALDGGDDGLDAYRAIFESAPSNLLPGGMVAVEIGIGQSSAVADIARRSGFSTVETIPDLGNRARIVLAMSP